MNNESQNIEYKLILNDRFERTIVSFLNSNLGGVVFIGIDNEGNVAGVDNCDEVQMQISDRIKNNISPTVLGLYDIHIKEKNSKKYIKVVVSSGTEKPYFIKNLGMTSDGCLIRIGSQTQNLTQQMIENLFARRTRNNIRVIESPRQDLTFNQLKIYYEEHHKLLNENFARTLEFYTPSGKYNILAYLLADENGVSIKVAKYSGTNKIDLIQNEEFGFCSILKACDRVLDKFRIEDRTFTKITSKFRQESEMFNYIALREAIINAFVHNDYTDLMTPVFEIFSDRIEITPYGGLIDGMTMEELISGVSRPRNREIMRVFKDMDFVEQLGSGMNRMLNVYSSDIFNVSPNFFKVVIKLNGTLNGQSGTINGTLNGQSGTINGTLNSDLLNESENTILNEIKNNPFITTEALSSNTGIPLRSVARTLKSLREKNIITRIGAKKNGSWKVN